MHAVETSKLAFTEAVLDQIKTGEGVLLERNHIPIAVILPIQPSDGPRPFGLCKGEFVVPDDFNDPLPEWEELFEARPDRKERGPNVYPRTHREGRYVDATDSCAGPKALNPPAMNYHDMPYDNDLYRHGVHRV